jgi:archaetidylinositol phosphate synthase
MLSGVKEKFEKGFNWIAKSLLKAGFTPNSMTIIGFTLSVIAAFFYYTRIQFWYIWIATAMLIGSGICDTLDGIMARLSNKVTSFGNFLDSVIDRYSDVIIICAIMLATPNNIAWSFLGMGNLAWGFLALFGSLLVSYIRAKAESLGVQLASVGIAERPERMLILVITSAALWPEVGIIIIAILANLTVFQRAIYVYWKLKKR